MEYSNNIVYIYVVSDYVILHAKSKVGGKIFVRNCKSVYRHCFFCMVWDRAYSKVFCFAL